MALNIDVQQQFAAEEKAYWQQRDDLLQQFAGQWVAIVGGRVVASAEQMNKAAAEAFRKTGSTVMYVNLVGTEGVVLRARRPLPGKSGASRWKK